MGVMMIDPKTGKKRGYTTGEVSKLVGVSPRTAALWADSGQIDGSYRLPNRNGNSACRRVFPADSLLRFLRDNDMPIPAELARRDAVLLVSEDDDLRGELAKRQTHYRLHAVASIFEAGRLYESLTPSVVVVDAFGRRGAALELVRALNTDPAEPRVLAIATEDDDDISAFGGVDTFRRPFDVRELAVKLDALILYGAK